MSTEETPRWMTRCQHTQFTDTCPADPFGRKCYQILLESNPNVRSFTANQCADQHFRKIKNSKTEHDPL